MSRHQHPRHRASTSARRAASAAAAATVTVLALSGAAGFGPQSPSALGARESTGGSTGSSSAGVTTTQSSDASSESTGPAGTDDQGTSGSTSTSDHSTGTSNHATGTSHETGTSSHGDSSHAGATNGARSLPDKSGHGRRIVYDIGDQRVWLVGANGDVKRTYRVSGSRNPGLLPPNIYSVSSKSRHAVSYNYKETMDYMVRFAYGHTSAIGFHDIPVSLATHRRVESRKQLGTPISAGCVRQWEPDARALYHFARVGTTVVVTA